MKDLEKYLLEAVGKLKEDLSEDNPYRNIGFDLDKNRLGWLRVYSFEDIKKVLESFSDILYNKEYFIFVGMGGSINGVGVLLNLFKNHNLHIINSLDPLALKNLLLKIKSIEKTFIVSISKSGSTLETQLLSSTLKELFKNDWKEHFLWLTDKTSFEKLDNLGWYGVRKATIQFDGLTDIGGRFSSPTTVIFFLPLFLLLKGDFSKLEKIYNRYISLQPAIRKKAYELSMRYSKKKNAYFSPIFEKENINKFLVTWVIQLFQESLGSKRKDLSVKTIENCLSGDFSPLKFKLDRIDKITLTMCRMYFFEVFIAFYSAIKKINFVNQDYVERYKVEIQRLQDKEEIKPLSFKDIIKKVKDKLKKKHKFIEIVLYCYPATKLLNRIKVIFEETFKDRLILIFTGSDWNHHSYQSAFLDKNTLYVFLFPSSYTFNVEPFSSDTLKRNTKTLKMISEASYVSLMDKSLLFSFLT